MYACMTPVGFDTSDKFENHWSRRTKKMIISHPFPCTTLCTRVGGVEGVVYLVRVCFILAHILYTYI